MKKNYFSLTMFKASLSGLALFAAAGLQAQGPFQMQSFSFTGGMQTATVPSCAGNVTIVVYGAEGVGADGFSPGLGGAAKGVLAVTPGQVLNLFIGGQNGFNGGGQGMGVSNGGGATDVRVGGIGLANRVIVAGGGGGAGGDNWGCFSGSGDGGGGIAVGTNFVGGAGGAGYTPNTGCGTSGGANGGNGGNGFHGGGGGGGGLNTGGVGATALNGSGSTGSLGQGGDAYQFANCSNTGGGGGGYYGGGGAAGENCGAGRGGGGSSWTGTLASPDFTPGIRSGNGMIVLYFDYNFNGVQYSMNPPGPVCPGTNVTINASNVNTYTWQPGNTGGTSINVTAGNANSHYTVQGNNSQGCMSTAIITLSVFPGPPLAVSPTSTFLCVGQPLTLNASGASNYTWTSQAGSLGNNPQLVVSPAVSTTYQLLASANGCTYSVSSVVTVNTLTLSVSANTLVCPGKPVTLGASGANSYNWSNANWPNGIPFQTVSFTPSVASVYSVSGVDANNCTISNTVSVGLHAQPNITATSSKSSLCIGESVNLTAGGGNTYTWNVPNGNGASVNVIMPANLPITYSVSSTDNNGCVGKATVVVTGLLCTGIEEQQAANAILSVYPNPNTGVFTIRTDMAAELSIVNTLGQNVKTISIPQAGTTITVEGLPAGIYFIAGESNGQKFVKKIVVEK